MSPSRTAFVECGRAAGVTSIPVSENHSSSPCNCPKMDPNPPDLRRFGLSLTILETPVQILCWAVCVLNGCFLLCLDCVQNFSPLLCLLRVLWPQTRPPPCRWDIPSRSMTLCSILSPISISQSATPRSTSTSCASSQSSSILAQP